MSGIGRIKVRLVPCLSDRLMSSWVINSCICGALPTWPMATWTKFTSCATATGPMSPFSLPMMPTVAGWRPGLKAMRMKPLRSCTMPAQEPTFRRCTRSGISSVSPRAWLVRGNELRDIMSYKLNCGGCPPLAGVVTPSVLVGGAPAGSVGHDNARVIADNVCA